MNSRSTEISRTRRLLRSKRGTVLMVALILAAAIAVALTSYMGLTTNAAKMANRSFYMDGAQNLCDLGIEQALWSMNNADWTSSGNFALRSGTTTEYQGTFPTSSSFYQLSAGVQGQVKVWADMANTARPHVVVQTTVSLPGGGQIMKMAEAYMQARSYFENGIVGRTLDLNGTVDSWDSRTGAYNPGSFNANAKIAATTVKANANNIGQADIYGYAAAGTSDASGFKIGSKGIVGDASYVDATTPAFGTIQDGHATYDFTQSFPDVSNPTVPALSDTGATYSARHLASAITTVPNGTERPASDGKYYYTISSISLQGNSETLVIDEDCEVVIIVQSTGNNSVAINGGGVIEIEENAQLQLYTAGGVSITGNGITNVRTNLSQVGQPINFQLYGTRDAATAASSGQQSISINGNGVMSGVIYAPNANIDLTGGGEFLGAVVGNTVTFSGSGVNFHVDESLMDTLTIDQWKIRKWRELSTASERATYADELAF